MKVRRIVTARNSLGKSVFDSVSLAPRNHDYEHIPGMSNTQIWSTPPFPNLDLPVSDPTAALRSVVPPPGGTQFMIVTFPPDTVMQSPTFDALAAAEEDRRVIPGLAERFEPDCPGMHCSETVDYGIVLEGEIALELDDGRVEHLHRHDVVIQNGTRHAWRNGGSTPAVMAFVLIGATRTSRAS